VNYLVHEDSLQKEAGWDAEGANVLFHDSFAVEVQDPGNCSI
jgi:hypothetical protein